MKLIYILLLLTPTLFARDKGQIEITTDEGIEVFQKEKYYLLKKNVKIDSDDFILTAEQVKAFFEKDLYDIKYIESEGSVKFISNDGVTVYGEKLTFSSKNNNIHVSGINSSILIKNITMKSNGYIKIDDLKGKFKIEGPDSLLLTENISIFGNNIEGEYNKINNINKIINLTVIDNDLSEIKTDKLQMFSSKAIFSEKNNLIELFDNVKVIRDSEIIIGDYAKINTLDESYKIISKKSNKVKILIDNNQ